MKKYLKFIILLSLFLVGCNKNPLEKNVEDTITTTMNTQEVQINEEIEEEQVNVSLETTEKIEEIEETVKVEIIEKDIISEEVVENEEPKEIEETLEMIEEVSEVKTEGDYENITLAFVGDTYLSDQLYNNYLSANEEVTGFLSEKVSNNFKEVDIMVANHEYVATDLPDSARDTRQLYNFKAPTSREYLWNEMGVDVLSLANNHAMDYGEKSLFDTIETLDSLDLAHIGAGKDLEDAKKAYITEINGKKIGILAACRFIVDGEWYATEDTSGVLTTYDTTPYFEVVKKEVSQLKNEEQCDFVIVYVHFGTEKTNKINDNQPLIAHGYINSGADAVIGSHAHQLQGVEIYNGKPIYYNLGNFLFGSYQVDTMVVNISINEDNTCSTSILPCISSQYKIKDANTEDFSRILNYIESISVNVEIDENGNVFEK